MGAPVGNRNAAKPRLFDGALRRAINEAGADREVLLDIAKALLAKALEGDLAAIKEVRDTLDGKPAQSVTVGGDPDNPLQTVSRVERVIVDANATNPDR
jgi:hypothetical protein